MKGFTSYFIHDRKSGPFCVKKKILLLKAAEARPSLVLKSKAESRNKFGMAMKECLRSVMMLNCII